MKEKKSCTWTQKIMGTLRIFAKHKKPVGNYYYYYYCYSHCLLLGIRGWRKRAENRDEWNRLMRDGKAQKRL